jgi:hypothetical protein
MRNNFSSVERSPTNSAAEYFHTHGQMALIP